MFGLSQAYYHRFVPFFDLLYHRYFLRDLIIFCCIKPKTYLNHWNHEIVCETCINWSCSKAKTFLRSTDTFDPVCFLYASLWHISKAKTIKRTLLQADKFFQSSAKKTTRLTRTQIKILGISYELLVSVFLFTLSFGQVSKTCRRMHLKFRGHVPV